MKCAVCKNGDIINKVIDYQTKIDGNYVLVKNVPVEECNVCGEQFVSYETAIKIEEIIKANNSLLVTLKFLSTIWQDKSLKLIIP